MYVDGGSNNQNILYQFYVRGTIRYFQMSDLSHLGPYLKTLNW